MSRNGSLAKVKTMLLNLVRNLNIITAKYLQETTTENSTEGTPLCTRNHAPKACIQETTTQDRSLHE